MPVTNEFERDLVNQAHLKHPGRVDMIVFQNTADAGDGSPGIQRCFRNYLHQGGMEDDIDLVAKGIIGTSVNINNAELQQLSNIGASVITTGIWTQLSNIGASVISSNEWSQIANIGAVTINVTQWGYLGASDQGISKATSVQFAGLALTGNLTLAGNSINGTSVNINNAEMQQLSNIGVATISGTQWGYVGGADQPVKQADSPTFIGLTLSADLVTTSTIDSVNVSTFKSDYDTHKASTGIDHSYIDQSVVLTASPTFVGLTLSAALVTSSTVDGVDVSALKLNSMPTVADGDIDANSQKIINLAAPTANTDAMRYQDLGIGNPSTTVQHSNNTTRSHNNPPYEKLKEVIVYRYLKDITVKWEHYTGGGMTGYTKVYVNGVAVGVEKSTASGSPVTVTDNISNLYTGDLLQIYGHGNGSNYVFVENMEIRYDNFTNNDP